MSTEKETTNTTLKTPDLCERRVLFGIDLKNLRMGQNFALADVAEKTRINIEYIDSLENGNFDRLPGRLFGRGFVAALLKHYGVSPEKLSSEYEQLWIDDGIQNSISDSTKRRIGENNATSAFTRMPTGASAGPVRVMLALALLVGVLGAAFVGYKKGRHYFSALFEQKKTVQPAVQHEEQKSTASRPEGAKSAQVETPENKSVHDDIQDSGVQQKTKIIASGNVGQQILSITVLEPVKMKIESDDGKPIIKDFAEGIYNYNFNSTADLLIYDAAAVKISFNGNSLGTLGTKGRVRRIGFRAEAPDQKSF